MNVWHYQAKKAIMIPKYFMIKSETNQQESLQGVLEKERQLKPEKNITTDTAV